VPTRDDWPSPGHRRPPRSSPTYAVRAPLAAWLQAEAARAAAELGSYRVLDVGCGPKPYFPFFEPHAAEYVGVDVANPSAELEGTVESLPVPDGSFELVLCTQVLEHADDPARAVSELRRVVAPGGRVLASTHGVQVYHPNPDDYWRWTHVGLERLFSEHGDWASVTVTPGSGTAACVGMVVGIYVNLALRKARLTPLARGAVWTLNRTAEAVDRHSRRAGEPRAGALFANYHVVAEAPRG
jgi:SAM-dependent methyltransferase